MTQTSFFLDVEAGDSCPYSMQMVFSTLGEPRRVDRVRIYHRDPEGEWCAITGWETDNTPSPAWAARVEDSGQAMAFLVYGGSNGIRMAPQAIDAPDWAIHAAGQWGESHLLLAEDQDIHWTNEA
ncbi:MAG: hypothetical protein AAB289_08810 [Chloroflexota bacterium]